MCTNSLGLFCSWFIVVGCTNNLSKGNFINVKHPNFPQNVLNTCRNKSLCCFNGMFESQNCLGMILVLRFIVCLFFYLLF